MLRRAVFTNGLSGLCVTKLDVLDGLPEIRICVAYRLDGKQIDRLPLEPERFQDCEPVYESLPGWTEPTAGVTEFEALPAAAKVYLGRLESLLGIPVDIVSTGPGREAIVFRAHPFG
jgi:adenylosuccinate synthase